MNIRTAPIEQTADGYFRCVDHTAGLASVGFLTREGLERNRDILRIDASAEARMRARYMGMFPTTIGG